MNAEKKINEIQDCWRRIGIWGNESTRCEKLKLVKHCRNCEVFESAARDALAERRKSEQGESLSIDELIEKESLAGDKSLLPFRIGAYCIAVPSSSVLTISDQVAVHTIPYNNNPVVKGLVAINHEVYTFIGLADLLDMKSQRYGPENNKLHSLFKRALVVDLIDQTVVFYVDEVYPIQRYFEKDVSHPNDSFPRAKLLRGILNRTDEWCSDCHLLDLELSSKFLKALIK